MFALPFFRRDLPVLHGKGVMLRTPTAEDYVQWARLRGESRTFLEPWEPLWSDDELDRPGWRRRLGRYREDMAQGVATAFLIFDRNTRELLGGISIGNIRHGVSESANIGYWMGERHAGKGIMVEAVKLVCGYGFSSLRLHRVEAACIPDNHRSIRVLEKAGFRREGLLRSYLRINGEWRDHLLYALLASDQPEASAKG
jgi:ribosomal-protein-alanine N-acetyltransferase